ncbi:DUF4079 domain-containing protein [Geitlerinema sp. PCC 9228]|jgi:hypothetical protein|uniref:DUF4079 domain-containing protein n=1 Tax=Geitlerinema sp. PCC 9228 TaxID=111611 RepID=UPI0008F9DA6C|nr:DUF4079 domain-containing protein [Geitlerinema sp. PCC 9228]
MNFRDLLEAIANYFIELGVPDPIVRWGHPIMMGIVILVMGSFVAWSGWRSRLATDVQIGKQNRASHRLLAPSMTLFMVLGFPGGVLSLVMQDRVIFQSTHFWTGIAVLALLFLNGFISITKFGGEKASLRTAHAYIGSIAIAFMLVHMAFGIQLGLSS